MKCPKCQSEIKDNAKFCTKCGCNLAEELAKMKPAAPQQPVQPQAQQDKVCVKCGAPIKPGARFCTKCGTPVAQPAPVQPTVEAPKPAPAPVQPTQTPQPKAPAPVQPTQTPQPKAATPVQPAPTPQPKAATPVQPAPTPQPKAVTPVQPTPAPQPKAAAPVKPASAQPKPAPASNKQPKPAKPKSDEKASPALIIVVVVLAVLVIVSGIVCFLVWNGTISLPFGGTVTEETIDEEESTEATTEAETSTVDVDELFAEADTLAETGKGQIAVDAEIVDGMNNLNAAIREYASKAEEAGDISLAVDRINDAYVAYITAIVRHKDMLSASTLSGAIYKQILIEMDDAAALGDDLAAKGYEVDYSSLTSAKDEFIKSYTDRIVAAFDEFTKGQMWSRTECWNLMSETPDNMFDNSDLDNPLRLRYAYALSWWIQKQIESELASGTITTKGAAIKIGGMIETMDYNPMMINYYISYMNDAGEDCSEVSQAYDDIVNQLSQTQGIVIGQDIPLEHFWYFNDFGEYSGDMEDGSTNGVTPENRQWIRDRMANVTFVTQ